MVVIDVHVLTIPGREHWLAECLDSLKDEPINLHVVPGIVGNFPESRRIGYIQGEAEWVTYVDDDDRVIPGAFTAIKNAMHLHKDSEWFWSYEELIDVTGRVISSPNLAKASDCNPHHLVVYKRSLLNDNQQVFQSKNPDYSLMKLAVLTLKGKLVNRVCYQWRINPASHSKERIYG